MSFELSCALVEPNNPQVLKDSNNDFQALGRDAAVLAAAVYRLHSQKSCVSRPQLHEQVQVMVEYVKCMKSGS